MINNDSEIILYLAKKGFEAVIDGMGMDSLDDGVGNAGHEHANAYYSLEDTLWKYGISSPRRDYGLLSY